MVNLVCFQVIGHDLAITLAAEGGQLQLNAFEPLIAHNTLDSISLLTNAVNTLSKLCVEGIEANPENCLKHLEVSTATLTALVPYIGYERAAALAKGCPRHGQHHPWNWQRRHCRTPTSMRFSMRKCWPAWH